MTPGEGIPLLTQWIQGQPPITFLLTLAGAAVLGLLVGAATAGRRAARGRELQKELAHAEKRIAALRQSKTDLEGALETLKIQNRRTNSLIPLLPDAVERLNTSTGMTQLLRNIVGITERLLQARNVSVFLRDKDSLILRASARPLPEGAPPLRIAIGEGKIGWVARKGITMTDRDLASESALVRENLTEEDTPIRTKICSPMIYNGNLLGVLNVGELPEGEEHALRIVRMITSLAAMALGNLMLKDQLQSGSEKDPLTGLYSLQYFVKELGKELGKARRYKRPLSVCHFNIDSFQQYNERNGYLAGDEVLRTMGKILRDHVRDQDIVARYGGAEFVLICPETPAEDALRLAEKLRGIIQEFPFPHGKGMPGGRLTVSSGVAGYPGDGTDETELIHAVTEATRYSTASGRNRVSPAGTRREASRFKIQS